MRFMRLTQACLSLTLAAAAGSALLSIALPTPALAQFSKYYKFLEAMRNRNKEADQKQLAIDALSEPGSSIVNTRDSTTGQTALHIVTAERDLPWISYLLAHGADANARDVKGGTPLALASTLGFAEGVQLLINGGARIDEAGGTGETPLISAVLRRDLAMMRVLLKAGANPDRADNSGGTARDYARLQDRSGTLLGEIDTNAKPQSSAPKRSYGPSL